MNIACVPDTVTGALLYEPYKAEPYKAGTIILGKELRYTKVKYFGPRSQKKSWDQNLI